jgi:FtsP/CotA-like multicopper oxidase with cupredoxin domain
MISRRIVCIFVVAAIAAIFSLATAMSLFIPLPSSGQQEAAAQQQNDTTNATTANQSIMPSTSSNKTFSTFPTEVQGLEETYIYSLPVIVANRGDSVTVSLHNTEGTTEEETGGGTTEEETGGGTTEEETGGGTTEEETGGGTTEEETGGGTEATEGRHSFTIDTQPYSVNIDTAGGETGNATFTADQEGIFQYYCMYHPQTMTGQLVVLPPPSSPATASSQPAT